MIRSPMFYVPCEHMSNHHTYIHLHIHILIPIILYYSERLAVSPRFRRKHVQDTQHYGEKCSLYQGLREADQTHRCPHKGLWEESFSESDPPYQVEREHVKYKGFKVLKSPAFELQFFSFVQKILFQKPTFNTVQWAVSR